MSLAIATLVWATVAVRPHAFSARSSWHWSAQRAPRRASGSVPRMCSAPDPLASANATVQVGGTSYEWSREADIAPAPFVWQLRRKAAQQPNLLGIRERAAPPGNVRQRAVQAVVLIALIVGCALSLFFGISRDLLPSSFVEEPPALRADQSAQ
uniref:Uncharacterized protein n=1 Tax=Diacronema lutheri TaxID=2081491 RepID=A0A7R9YIL7_DIALT|mmetsp:Transcript_14031/g.43856  ORF Transcript_14031/g.43856 Transcript_14031/m.43856 type:complete len:154 (+) Transcript_14031:114-575(+)